MGAGKMAEIKVTDKRFETDNVIHYAEDTWISYNKSEQGEFIIPSTEVFDISMGVKFKDIKGEFHLLCPNVNVLEHNHNVWARDGEKHLVCSECGCRMDISNIAGKAKLEEK
jgi:hypothetical protein